VKAIDTNVLVYATREELPQHAIARALLTELAEGPSPWALPWCCVYEYIRVVTHPRIFAPPTPLQAAVANMEALFGAPSIVLLGDGPRHSKWFSRTLLDHDARGNHVFDAHIVALMREHGVDRVVTADSDFHRYSDIQVDNPFR
jgi:uncharacterized protein